jgi:glycosyltransferase involved in cell wall biosynthesis
MRILVISNIYPPIVRGGYEVECSYAVESLRHEHEVLVLTSDAGPGQIDAQPGVRRELPYVIAGPRGSLRAPTLARSGVRSARRILTEFEPELVYVWNGTLIPQAVLRDLDRVGAPLAYRVCEHWFGHVYRTDQFMRHLYGDDRGLRRIWAYWPRAVNSLPPLRLELRSKARVGISWNSEFMRSHVPVPPTFIPVHESVTFPVTPQCDFLAEWPRRPFTDPTVAFVGRLTWEKGPEIAIRAVAELRAAHGFDARLVFAGDVKLRAGEELTSLARELGVRIELCGRLDRVGIAELLGGAHALVMPAMWEEPAPMTCIEGALARVPVVAARTGGIPEMLREGEHALLFPMGDVEACARALADTLTNTTETEARVQRAFTHCKQFSFARYEEANRRFVADTLAAFPDRTLG